MDKASLGRKLENGAKENQLKSNSLERGIAVEQSSYTMLLDQITKEDFLLVGGKGANLGEMIRAGLPVPGGFVLLTHAYRQFIEANQLGQCINRFLEEIDHDNLLELEQTAEKIQALFEDSVIPEDILEEIDKAYEIIGNAEVAVRSSATAEDLPGTSFAGQYNTYLNVKGRDELYKYVKKCWASLWNYRALSYRIRQNIGNHDLAHGVIVQAMVNAEKSGILFTANPVNGRRDQMLLNASWGLGEAVVGGEVTPDQWVLDKTAKGVVQERIAKKEIMTVRKEKGIEFVPVPGEKQEAVTLNRDEVSQMLNFGHDVERYFGSPQDIEWAYQNGKFYLVQTRPVTSLYPMPEEIENKKGLRVYINFNNYSQAMPEPFTPMGEEGIRMMLQGVVNKLGRKRTRGDNMWWCQVIGGRVFLDITDFVRTEKSWNKFKKVDPSDKDPVTTKALLQFLQRNKEEIIDPKQSVKLAGLLNLRLVKFLAGAAVKYFHGIYSPVKAREKAVGLGDGIIEQLQEERKKLRTVEDKLDFIQRNGSDLFTEGFGIVFYVAVSSTYIEKARKIMAEHLEDTSDLKHVEKSVPYSATTEMGMEILELAKIYDHKGKRPHPQDKEIRKFLEQYGHRAAIELDVGVPVWKENPQYVLDLINSYIDNQNYQEAIDKFNRGKEEAALAIARIKARLEAAGQKRKARKVEKLLKDFREMFGIREQSKFFVRQFLSIFREVLIEVGEVLAEEGRIEDKLDVFYVTGEDIQSNRDLKAIVRANKEQYRLNMNKTAPRLLTSTGESIHAATGETDENTLVGIPVSPGVYEGRVRVLRSPDEGHKLEKGDILVTAGTNPAWTPLFLKLGALVMETGGPISHGSVVAREYGVPAVAGLAKAAAQIKDGQVVRVNGETGSVEILS